MAVAGQRSAVTMPLRSTPTFEVTERYDRKVAVMHTRRFVPILASLLIATACGGSGVEDAASTTAAAATIPTTPPSTSTTALDLTTMATATSTTGPFGSTLDKSVVVDTEGRKAAVRCWGEGSPVFMLDTGMPGSGIDDSKEAAFTDEMVSLGTFCTYDRLGEGASDGPPNRLRTADDTVDVLHTVIEESGIETPVVLIGGSFGGMIVTHYAATHPENAAAVILLDVPAPVADLPYPELEWDHPTNVERLDIVNGFEGRFAESMPQFDAPLLVITADGGQSDVEDQSVWLESTDDAVQVELHGGHDIASSSPAEVASEIEAFLAGR
jgi:alpha/beta hydrolase fold